MSEIERLRNALADALDFITGDISGPSQRQGILREGFAVLASGMQLREDSTEIEAEGEALQPDPEGETP